MSVTPAPGFVFFDGPFCIFPRNQKQQIKNTLQKLLNWYCGLIVLMVQQQTEVKEVENSQISLHCILKLTNRFLNCQKLSLQQ